MYKRNLFCSWLALIKTTALSIDNLYPREKHSWYLLWNSQKLHLSLGQKSLNQQVSRIIKQHTPVKSVGCCLLPTQYTGKGILNTQRSHYIVAFLGIILKIHFLCSFPPYPLSFCWPEGFWRCLTFWKQKLLRISVGKLRKRLVSVHAPQISFSSWHRKCFLAPFKKPPGTASYLATLRLHQLESILLIFPCLEASQQ